MSCTMHFLFALAQILAEPSPPVTQAHEAGLRLPVYSANIQKSELNQTTKHSLHGAIGIHNCVVNTMGHQVHMQTRVGRKARDKH